jgi:hypothetical protein
MIGATPQYISEVSSSQQVFAGAFVFDNNGRCLEETLRFGYFTNKAPIGFLAGYYSIGNFPKAQKLMLTDGSVTHDKRADVWRTADVEFLDVTGTGAGQYLIDPLSSYELLVYRGIRLTGNLNGLTNWEWKPQGMFTSQGIEIIRYGDALVYKVQLSDRTQRIKDNPWKSTFSVSSSIGNYVACIKAVINDRAKGFTPDYTVLCTDNTTPPSSMAFAAGSNPWDAVQQIAQAANAEVFFDGWGRVVIRDYVDNTLAKPVAVYSKDSQLILEQPDRQVSKTDVFNGVIVRGSASWLLFPVTGEVWDDDPSSPTWRLGAFGEKPKIIENNVVGSSGSAATIAATEFKKIKGVWEDLTFKIYPDPRFEIDDCIRIDDSVLQVQQKADIAAITMPLISGDMTAVVRRRR